MNDPITVVLAIATIALAVFTALMWWSTRSVALGTGALGRETAALARETADLARETVAASALADRHHQETLTPLVVLEDVYVDSPSGALRVQGIMRNVGPGIATDVRIWIGDVGEKIQLGPLASSQAKPINCSVPVGNDVPQKMPIKLAVLYDNLFKSEGKTEHFGNCHVKEPFTTVFYAPPLVTRVGLSQ